jgi:hypothetical protein
MQGLPTIRAYSAQSRFRDEFLAQMDANGSWWFAFIATARWVGFRLDNIAASVLMLASIFVMALHSKVLRVQTVDKRRCPVNNCPESLSE